MARELEFLLETGVPLYSNDFDGVILERLRAFLLTWKQPLGRLLLEQRLAYLLYHCGLGPREIVRFYPQEWSDVQEIHCLQCAILERLLSNANQLALEA